jgi:hypothetical protein
MNKMYISLHVSTRLLLPNFNETGVFQQEFGSNKINNLIAKNLVI